MPCSSVRWVNSRGGCGTAGFRSCIAELLSQRAGDTEAGDAAFERYFSGSATALFVSKEEALRILRTPLRRAGRRRECTTSICTSVMIRLLAAEYRLDAIKAVERQPTETNSTRVGQRERRISTPFLYSCFRRSSLPDPPPTACWLALPSSAVPATMTACYVPPMPSDAPPRVARLRAVTGGRFTRPPCSRDRG